MKFPPPQQTGRRRVSKTIYEHGPMTAKALVQKTHKAGERHKYNDLKTIQSMIRDGQLIDTDSVLSLPDEMKAGIADMIEIESKIKSAKVAVEVSAPRDTRSFGAGKLAEHMATMRAHGTRDINLKVASSAIPTRGLNE